MSLHAVSRTIGPAGKLPRTTLERRNLKYLFLQKQQHENISCLKEHLSHPIHVCLILSDSRGSYVAAIVFCSSSAPLSAYNDGLDLASGYSPSSRQQSTSANKQLPCLSHDRYRVLLLSKGGLTVPLKSAIWLLSVTASGYCECPTSNAIQEIPSSSI